VIVHGSLLYGLSALWRIPSCVNRTLLPTFLTIVDLLAIYACRVKISLALPVISNLVPVGYERNVEEHVGSKYRRAWRGFKDYMIGRANGPCRVVKEDIDVIRGCCLGHIEVRCAQHLC
jgi:hypothetical protein